jgi:hypothetical protein
MAALFSQDTRGVGDFNERGLYINWTLNRKEDENRSEIRWSKESNTRHFGDLRYYCTSGSYIWLNPMRY